MNILAITSFSPKGWDEYARDCLETWGVWPGHLMVYEEWSPSQRPPLETGWGPLNNDGQRPLLADPQLRRFLQGCDIFPVLKGIMRDGSYSYHYDAHKFARKTFAITNACKEFPNYDHYVWLDADIKMTEGDGKFSQLIDDICGTEKYVTYMGRPWWRHSECSFMVFNKRDFPEMHGEFMTLYREFYTKGLFIGLPDGWHDCYAFDICRKTLKPKELNLSAGGDGLNVMPQTVLAPYMTHLKGRAKHGGKSAE